MDGFSCAQSDPELGACVVLCLQKTPSNLVYDILSILLCSYSIIESLPEL